MHPMGYQKPPVTLALQHMIRTIGLLDTRGKKKYKNPCFSNRIEGYTASLRDGLQGSPSETWLPHGS
jgi:hypothetical protein